MQSRVKTSFGLLLASQQQVQALVEAQDLLQDLTLLHVRLVLVLTPPYAWTLSGTSSRLANGNESALITLPQQHSQRPNKVHRHHFYRRAPNRYSDVSLWPPQISFPRFQELCRASATMRSAELLTRVGSL